MARKEASTDYWVARMLDDCGIDATPQGSDNKLISDALKTASKRGTGNAGFPEFTAVINNEYALVIEDKADVSNHVLKTGGGVLDESVEGTAGYAVNGAYFYGKRIAQNSPFKKVFAVGVSGDEKHHEITPLWVNDRETYIELDSLESFMSFSPENIDEYYVRNVLREETDEEKTTEQILKDAKELHESLRTYGSLSDQNKPLVVAGILLALDESAKK